MYASEILTIEQKVVLQLHTENKITTINATQQTCFFIGFSMNKYLKGAYACRRKFNFYFKMIQQGNVGNIRKFVYQLKRIRGSS